MYCPFCRAKNPNDGTYCIACGADLRKEQNAVSDKHARNEIPQYSPPDPPQQQKPKKGGLSRGVIILIAAISTVAIIAIVALVVVLINRPPEPSPEATEAVKQVETETPNIEEIEKKVEEKSDEQSSSEQSSSTDNQSTSDQSTSDQSTDDQSTSDQSTEDQSTSDQSTSASDPSRTTKDLECKGVICQIPKLWILDNSDDGTVSAYPYSGNTFVLAWHMPLDGLDEYDLTDLAVASSLYGLEDTVSDCELVGKPTTKTLDDNTLEAARVEFTANSNDDEKKPYHFVEQWIKTENSYFVLLAFTDAEQWDATKEEIFGVFDSVHIPDPALAGTDNGYIVQDDKVQS